MREIKIEEVRGDKIKQNKYKSAHTRAIFIKAIIIGIIFAISMIILRCVTLWVLRVESAYSFKEILNNRYYYGSDKISLIKYMNGPFTNSLTPDFIMSFINNKHNFIIEVLSTVSLLIVAIPLAIIVFGSIPFLYFNMKVICVIDNIIPKTGNIFIWWFIYMTIVGIIAALIKNKKLKKRSTSSISKINVFSIVEGTMLIITIISFVGVKYIGSEFKEGAQNSYNIKALVDYSILDYNMLRTSEENILSSYEEVINYSKERTMMFSDILNANGIGSNVIANGLSVINSNSTYEKYTNSYEIQTAYKASPNFNEGKLEEGFYIYYEYPDLKAVED